MTPIDENDQARRFNDGELTLEQISALAGDDIASWLGNADAFMPPDLMAERICWWVNRVLVAVQAPTMSEPDDREVVADLVWHEWDADAVFPTAPAPALRQLRQHRLDWASWLESWDSAVGPEPPTIAAIIARLRADSLPFGVARADRFGTTPEDGGVV